MIKYGKRLVKLMMNLDQILDEIKKVSKEHLEDDYKKYIINEPCMQS